MRKGIQIKSLILFEERSEKFGAVGQVSRRRRHPVTVHELLGLPELAEKLPVFPSIVSEELTYLDPIRFFLAIRANALEVELVYVHK